VSVHYPGVRAYLESWLTNHMKGNLSAFCDWGDWCPYVGGCQSCTEDYGSYFLIRALDMTATMATLLGNTADAAKYTAQAAASRAAYRAAFLNNNTYAEGRPINQLFALSLGIPTAQERPAVYAVLRQAIVNGSFPLHKRAASSPPSCCILRWTSSATRTSASRRCCRRGWYGRGRGWSCV